MTRQTSLDKLQSSNFVWMVYFNWYQKNEWKKERDFNLWLCRHRTHKRCNSIARNISHTTTTHSTINYVYVSGVSSLSSSSSPSTPNILVPFFNHYRTKLSLFSHLWPAPVVQAELLPNLPPSVHSLECKLYSQDWLGPNCQSTIMVSNTNNLSQKTSWYKHADWNRTGNLKKTWREKFPWRVYCWVELSFSLLFNFQKVGIFFTVLGLGF